MTYRVGALLAILVPAVVFAQTTQTAGPGVLLIQESTDPNTEAIPIINAAECTGTPAADNLRFTWTPPTTITTFAKVRIDVSDQPSCPIPTTSNGAHTVQGFVAPFTIVSENAYPPTGSSVTPPTAAGLVSALSGDGAAVNCSTKELTTYVCAIFLDASAAPLTGGQANGTIQVQVLAPDAPSGVSASPGDSALNVSWSASGGAVATANYVVTAVAVDPTQDAATHSTGKVNTLSTRITGLVNNVAYNVTVVALSAGSNPSTPSTAVQGTPVLVEDFWRLYKSAGGHETGGCGAGGAGIPALLGLLPLLVRRRRA